MEGSDVITKSRPEWYTDVPILSCTEHVPKLTCVCTEIDHVPKVSSCTEMDHCLKIMYRNGMYRKCLVPIWIYPMRDARSSLFIFAVLSRVLRSSFRDTVIRNYKKNKKEEFSDDHCGTNHYSVATYLWWMSTQGNSVHGDRTRTRATTLASCLVWSSIVVECGVDGCMHTVLIANNIQGSHQNSRQLIKKLWCRGFAKPSPTCRKHWQSRRFCS